MTRTCRWGVLCFALVAGAVHADVLNMKNGDRITGTIKRIWDGDLAIEPEYGDEFEVDLTAVASIVSDRPFELEFLDHSEAVGYFGVDEAGNSILTVNDEVRPFPLDQLEELDEPADYFDWSVIMDLNSTVTKGNTDTSTLLWFGEGRMKFGDHRHQLNISVDRQETDGETTKEQEELRYAYEWLFTDDWYATGQLSYTADPIRDLDHRFTVGAGIGHDVWDYADRELKFALLYDYLEEKIGGESETSSAPHWQFRFRYGLLGGDAEFFHNHDIWYFVTGRSTEIITTSTGIRWEFIDDFYTNFRVDWNHETNPADGQKKSDTTFVVGLGMKFD